MKQSINFELTREEINKILNGGSVNIKSKYSIKVNEEVVFTLSGFDKTNGQINGYLNNGVYNQNF